MTLLTLNDYNTRSTEKFVPQWMREERYNYCEPVTFHTYIFSDFLYSIKKHIKKFFK